MVVFVVFVGPGAVAGEVAVAVVAQVGAAKVGVLVEGVAEVGLVGGAAPVFQAVVAVGLAAQLPGAVVAVGVVEAATVVLQGQAFQAAAGVEVSEVLAAV